jgi:hypothetical protein
MIASRNIKQVSFGIHPVVPGVSIWTPEQSDAICSKTLFFVFGQTDKHIPMIPEKLTGSVSSSF